MKNGKFPMASKVDLCNNQMCVHNCHNIAEILMKVALNTINPLYTVVYNILYWFIVVMFIEEGHFCSSINVQRNIYCLLIN